MLTLAQISLALPQLGLCRGDTTWIGLGFGARAPLVPWGHGQCREGPSEAREVEEEWKSQTLCRAVQTGTCKWVSG